METQHSMVMLSTGKFEQLKAFYLFLVPTLNEASWDRCEKVLQVRNFKKGEMILSEGQICNHVSFMNHGLVRMYYQGADGREKIICFFNENNYISDYPSFLTRKPAMLNIQALENTELVDTSYDQLQQLYQEVPEANLLGRMIAEQLFIKLNEGNASSINDTIEHRYTSLLNEQPWLMQKVPQYMIASYLGITPEALSRVKARMNKPHKVKVLAEFG